MTLTLCSVRSANRPNPEVLSAIETLIRDGEDRHLCRINVLAFAAQRGLNEEKVISAFLHASRLGLFELNWNVLCPGCGGVLDSSLQLKSVHKEAYDCSLCSKAYEPTLQSAGAGKGLGAVGDLHCSRRRAAQHVNQVLRRASASGEMEMVDQEEIKRYADHVLELFGSDEWLGSRWSSSAAHMPKSGTASMN